MATHGVPASGRCCASCSTGSAGSSDEPCDAARGAAARGGGDPEDSRDHTANDDLEDCLEGDSSNRQPERISPIASEYVSEFGSEDGSEEGSEDGSDVLSLYNKDTFPEIGPSMHRVLPRRLVAWFGIVICIPTVLVVACFTYRVYRVNGYTHSMVIGAAVLVSLIANVTLRIAGLLRERWLVEHEELLIFWSCVLSGFFAAFACARDPDQFSCKGIRFSGAVPEAPVSACMSCLWSLASQLPRWFVFEECPRTRWQLLAVVALMACTLLAPLSTYMLIATPCAVNYGKATMWFALGFLVAAQVLAGQLIRVIRAGVGTGFRVVACPLIMVLGCLGASVVQNDDVWDLQCWACSALFACAIVCGGVVTHVPEEICSTSPLYERERSIPTNAVCGAVRSAQRYAKTWRGTLVMCAVNSIISAWVYRPWVKRSYNNYYVFMSEDERYRSFTPLHIGSADTSCRIILALATLSFCICVVSMVSDRCKKSSGLQGSAVPRLPMDRHFRCITAAKVGMIIVKTDFLMTYTDSKASGWATITQVISIASTVVCANWSIISMFQAALDISHEFAGMFRYPVTLWRVSITCLLLWNSMNGVLLLFAVLDVVGIDHFLGVDIPSPQDLSWLGVVMPVGSKWLYIGNELALVLSSKLSHPQVFAAVQSRQGIVIVATLGAVGTPMTMLCKGGMWLLHCNNRKLGLQEGLQWETCVCAAVSVIFMCGGIVAYASLG